MRRRLSVEKQKKTPQGMEQQEKVRTRMMLLFWAGGIWRRSEWIGQDGMGWDGIWIHGMDGMEWPENARQTRPTGLHTGCVSTATVEVNVHGY